MQNEARFENPFFRQLGYAIWGVMLVLALVFYKERAFFMDAGFQLFNLINEETIQVYHYRFITGVPQLLPFVLLKMSAPLWLLAMSFSAAYILFYAAVYHLLVRQLKNDYLGWALIFLFTLISLDTFYHIQSEFYLGLSLLLLVFGLVWRYPAMREKWMFPLLLPLLVTVGFSHKLSLIYFLFFWIFSGLKNGALRHKRYAAFLLLMLAIAAVKSIWFTGWYEAAKQVDFKNNWAEYFPGFHTIPANTVFLERSLHHYYMLPLMLAIVTVFYFYKKQWLKIFLVWGFSGGYLLLYNISDPHAPYRFYSEVTYLPLSLFVALPFLFDLVPEWQHSVRWKKWLPLAFVGVMALRLITIGWNHQTFDRQFSWIENQMKKGRTIGTNRFLLPSRFVPMDTVLMTWGVPFTAMHLSALEHPDSAKTLLILPSFERYEKEMKGNRYFLSPFKAMDLEELNQRYYNPGPGEYFLLK
ncbi:MAG: hypothetical protein EPO28_10330 [Saprospiraceae bacterium]|nr:MAG: hypothetical protein EPO28_10330 [Saprospiraceae bacterium]